MYISTKQVLSRLGISRTTLHNMRRRGDFVSAHEISERRIAFSLADVDAWLASRTRP